MIFRRKVRVYFAQRADARTYRQWPFVRVTQLELLICIQSKRVTYYNQNTILWHNTFFVTEMHPREFRMFLDSIRGS